MADSIALDKLKHAMDYVEELSTRLHITVPVELKAHITLGGAIREVFKEQGNMDGMARADKTISRMEKNLSEWQTN